MVTVHQPAGLVLAEFVAALKRHGVTISSYFTTEAPTFRIGAIGDIGLNEVTEVLRAVTGALEDLGLRRAA